MIPEAPSPATARPIMSIAEELAAPQRTDPISKSAKQQRYTHYKYISRY